ncbi:MAG: S8 family serine peptidase, partial [Alphaproteobacteria bacterium]|nr:S8 family serine peptidase [Alphaproteobacteria bacterium]
MSSFHEISRRAAVFLLLTLAACGGGGGSGGGGGGGGLPTPDPLAAEQPASNFENTADFDPCIEALGGAIYCNYGLGQIGAADVYAKGASGAGVVVAVVDSGIDTAHVELDSKISGASTDIAAPGTPLGDELGHGTMVAGVIAAERNDIGTHGVAFGSTILALRTDDRNPDGTSTGTFTVTDITAAISYAAGKAHVINISLGVTGTQLGDPFGNPDEQAAFEQALIDAMAADAIIVIATGNDSAPEASLPAAYAGDTTVNASGQMVAVGAVNNAGDALADFSNYCGLAMDYCLVAPGEGIWTDYPGNSLIYVSGTSFAAPYVSGSAALLIQLWPTLLPSEVVQILLTTATDMGDPGVDVVYGWGLLNLSAAILPTGTLEVPLTTLAGGETVLLDGTALSLGAAFGDALTNSELLSRTFALDDYDRNYGMDLNDLVVHSSRKFGLEMLLGNDTVETVEAALPNGMKIAMGVSDEEDADAAADWAGMAADAAESQKLRGFSLAVESAPGTEFRFGYDITPEQQMAGLSASEPAGLFWMPGDTLGPQHGLVGAGTGFSVSRQLDVSSVVSFGWVDQKDDPDILRRDAKIGEITLAHRFDNGAIGYAGFSLVDEQGGFLGSDAAGGLAVAGADTKFYSLGGRYPLGAGLELIGNYLLGEADMRADGTSLLGEWSEIRAEAFGVGLVKNGVLGRHDRIGLLAGQPLRVSSGEATVTAPVDYLIDKTVVQDSERVSMTPSGREIDLQLAY